MAHYANAQDSFSFWIDNEFGQPFRMIEGQCAAGGGPGELRYLDFPVLLFRFGFR